MPAVDLVEVDYLKENLKERPHVVPEHNIEQVRRLFVKWMEERHGIVVYQCHDMSSSSLGNTSYVPRMYDTEEKGMQPAPPRWNTRLASTQEMPVDWLQQPFPDAAVVVTLCGVVIPEREKLDPVRHWLDRWFIFQKGAVMVHLFTEALYDGSFGDLPKTKLPFRPRKKGRAS